MSLTDPPPPQILNFYMPERPTALSIRTNINCYREGMLIDVIGAADNTYNGKCIISHIDYVNSTIEVVPHVSVPMIYIKPMPEVENKHTKGKQQPSYTKLHKGWKGRY